MDILQCPSSTVSESAISWKLKKKKKKSSLSSSSRAVESAIQNIAASDTFCCVVQKTPHSRSGIQVIASSMHLFNTLQQGTHKP